MNYLVKIKSSNKIFIIKNNPIRSPFECIVPESDILLIKSRIKFYGISENEYEIELIDGNNSNDKKKDYSYIPSERKPDKREEKQSVIFSTIKNKNQSINQVKQKIKHEKITPEFDLSKNQKIEEIKPQENVNDFSLDIEQIINNQVSDFEKNQNNPNENIEVKIEELTVKSSSILEKFLNSEF